MEAACDQSELKGFHLIGQTVMNQLTCSSEQAVTQIPGSTEWGNIP